MPSVHTSTRRRTGCLECRRRKQQCDETKPVCFCCQRRKVTCSYPQPNLVTASKFNVKVAGDHVILPLKFVDRGGSALFINIKSTDFRLLCSSYDLEALENEDVPRKRPDEISVAPALSTWTTAAEDVSFCDTQTENQFVQYYLEVISNSRTYVPSESNLFLHAVAPVLFFGQGSVRSTILAMSAMEWSKASPIGTDRYAAAADYYKMKALQQLQMSLSNELLAEENLMTCILLTSMDISLGSQPTWLRHVRGALAVLDASAGRLSDMSVAFALRYTQFRYILMSTTQSRRRLNSQDAKAFRTTDETKDEVLTKLAAAKMASGTFARQLVDPLLGCSIELLDYICQISMLDDKTTDPEYFGSAENSFVAGKALEEKIRTLPVSVANDIDDYLLDSMECFRGASLIYLHLVVLRAFVNSNKISHLLGDLLHRLHTVINQKIPRRSFPMWPLFIAGVASVQEEDIVDVLGLFDVLKTRWPVSNISKVIEALQAIWQTRDLQTDTLNVESGDWQRTIAKFGWKLSLS